MRHLVMLAAATLLLAGCVGTGTPSASPTAPVAAPEPTDPPAPIRYIALGDTYTIGFGLPRQVDRWPNQLVRMLKPEVSLDLVDNLATQSAGTFEVIDEQLLVLEDLDPDLVTLQVGVNDLVISQLTEEEYRANLVTILDGRDGPPASSVRSGILDLVPPERVVLVTMPDYTLFARPGDASRVDRFNAIMAEVAAERGVAVVDITPIGDLVARDRTLLTDDQQHPSAKQYAGWVELLAPVVRRSVLGPPSPSPSLGPSRAVVG